MGRHFWADLIGEIPYENQSRGTLQRFSAKVANFEAGVKCHVKFLLSSHFGGEAFCKFHKMVAKLKMKLG